MSDSVITQDIFEKPVWTFSEDIKSEMADHYYITRTYSLSANYTWRTEYFSPSKEVTTVPAVPLFEPQLVNGCRILHEPELLATNNPVLEKKG
jgi:hypothetical protein